MAAGGWYRMHRGWQDDPLFAGDQFSRRDAWEWLIAGAAYEPHARWFKGHRVDLERGQIATSERELCEVWGWERQRVRTFIRRLETDQKVARESTRGLTKLTLCNYEKYQAEQPTSKPAEQPGSNPDLTQGQPTIEEGKEGEEGKETNEGGARFAFFGRTVKLNARDFEEWRRLFHSIPDLTAELSTLDSWLQGQSAAKREGWFFTVKGALNRKHQEILERRQGGDERRAEAPIC